ncbi:excalibur calcium-binding domain-containing protein [Naasia lichenicola]|uniref:DUF2510 domain-containing protein n=1 Tax=Naasia lichenicola TaxID=2565933 RepID=A0A4S4FMS5_9MICO|nr:excalibur calcium-binding domain-containing protein [Naasia lichenicola]THG30745.1 DUF2510 domain-containing protein [Naasia lichenicola]THG31982.1 DUF2510 domain-containing protein [Naasia lichenicola]
MNQAAPEGWYEDPSDPARLRWWDGQGWTEFAGDGPFVELEDAGHADLAVGASRGRGLWELEAESTARADTRNPTTGSLSIAAAVAAVRSGDVGVARPAEFDDGSVASDGPKAGLPEPDVAGDVEEDLALAASIAQPDTAIEPVSELAPESPTLGPQPVVGIGGPDPTVAAIQIIRAPVRQLAPSELLSTRTASDTAAVPIQYAETVRPRRLMSGWMIVIPIVWLILSLPAILAGWGIFAAALGLLPLLTGAYVAVTGRPSWLRLWSRQTGALLLAASLVLVVGGTIVNKAVHPVLVVDTGMLGFAAPTVPEVTWAGPSAAESDARQPIASPVAPAEVASPESSPAAEVGPAPVIETPASLEEPVADPQIGPVTEEPVAEPIPASVPPRADPAPALSYANCAAVWQANAAPIKRGDPGFQQKFDRDGDGTGCEKRP